MLSSRDKRIFWIVDPELVQHSTVCILYISLHRKTSRSHNIYLCNCTIKSRPSTSKLCVCVCPFTHVLSSGLFVCVGFNFGWWNFNVSDAMPRNVKCDLGADVTLTHICDITSDMVPPSSIPCPRVHSARLTDVTDAQHSLMIITV